MRQADDINAPWIEIGSGIQIENVWKFLNKEKIA